MDAANPFEQSLASLVFLTHFQVNFAYLPNRLQQIWRAFQGRTGCLTSEKSPRAQYL